MEACHQDTCHHLRPLFPMEWEVIRRHLLQAWAIVHRTVTIPVEATILSTTLPTTTSSGECTNNGLVDSSTWKAAILARTWVTDSSMAIQSATALPLEPLPLVVPLGPPLLVQENTTVQPKVR